MCRARVRVGDVQSFLNVLKGRTGPHQGQKETGFPAPRAVSAPLGSSQNKSSRKKKCDFFLKKAPADASVPSVPWLHAVGSPVE